MTLTKPILVTALMLLFAAEAAAIYTINGERKSFEAYRTDSPPVIDGKLDDAVWRDAVTVEDFHQTAPTYGAQPTEHTVVRVAYDDEYLYIAAHLQDSNPRAIQAT